MAAEIPVRHRVTINEGSSTSHTWLTGPIGYTTDSWIEFQDTKTGKWFHVRSDNLIIEDLYDHGR